MSFMSDLRLNLSKWVLEFIGKYAAKLAAVVSTITIGAYVWTTGALDNVLGWMWQSIPPGIEGQLSTVLDYMEMVNLWFPLGETIVLLAAYFTFVGIFISVKLFIKIFLPTLG